MDTLAELFAHVLTIFCTFGMICKKKSFMMRWKTNNSK
jgi:hypothetical protein